MNVNYSFKNLAATGKRETGFTCQVRTEVEGREKSVSMKEKLRVQDRGETE